MKRNKKEVKEHIKELLASGWNKDEIELVGHCESCGSFGFEDCDTSCQSLLKRFENPECQAEVLADQIKITEEKVG